MISKRITSAKDFGKVAVLFGGSSSEREVSLWSGTAVLNALISQGIDAHKVDPMEVDLPNYLQEQDFDRAFIILHGGHGEDGTIQAVLDYIGIPYTGSGVLTSALGMDKLKTKQIWQAQDLPVLPSYVLYSKEAVEALANVVSFPLAVKPSCEGSSIGVSRVDAKEDFLKAWVVAGGEKAPVFAEPWIVGKGEYTCAILHGKALPLIRLETDLAFYDFQAKYLSNDTRYFCPSGLDEIQEKALKVLVEKAFAVVDGYGWGRIDFLLDSEGHPWLLEVNTVPGMTSHSLVPMAAKEAGIDFETLCWLILESACKDLDG